MQLNIEDMSCGGCVANITEAIKKLDPEARITADLETRNINVSTAIAEADVRAALSAAGYPATE